MRQNVAPRVTFASQQACCDPQSPCLAPIGGYARAGVGQIVGLGVCQIGKGRQHRARVVVCKKPPKGRTHRDAHRRIVQGSGSRAHARSAKEAWVRMVSPALEHLSAMDVA